MQFRVKFQLLDAVWTAVERQTRSVCSLLTHLLLVADPTQPWRAGPALGYRIDLCRGSLVVWFLRTNSACLCIQYSYR